MKLAFNKESALAITRTMRANATLRRALTRRCELQPPDILPLKRWPKKSPDRIWKALHVPCDPDRDGIRLAVPARELRIRAKGVTCTAYAKSLPPRSFIPVGDGAQISSPELLFLEMADTMHPSEHLMLGHELCGTFCRDGADPYNGPIVYGLPPLTSVSKINAFLGKAHGIRGIAKARNTAALLNDNAWSPTESLVATFLRLPFEDLGFDMGELVLNPRTTFERELPGAKTSRVPDILIAGTPVGLNYDGFMHFDLDPVIRAAMEVGAHPETAHGEAELKMAVARTRAKLLDDIRRNRELAADGLTVLPITKEDLYQRKGFGQIVALLVDYLERFDGRNMVRQRFTLETGALDEARYRKMLSFLPGKHERDVQVGYFGNGLKVYEGQDSVLECWIEL